MGDNDKIRIYYFQCYYSMVSKIESEFVNHIIKG